MGTRILFFGSVKETAGGSERIVDLPDHINDRSALIDWLCADRDPLRAALSSEEIRLCIDQAIIADGEQFRQPEEIAFLPPFSGG